MPRTLALPLSPDSFATQAPFQLLEVRRVSRPALPRVERLARKGPLLQPGPFSQQPDVLGLNLTLGCGHRCVFCSVRGSSGYPGDGTVLVGSDTVARLAGELGSRQPRPRAVYLCPATDPFPPLQAVQQETARVIDLLASQGVEAWLMTRGFVRPLALAVLEKHRERVRLTVGLTTLDRGLQRLLEPLAAPPRLRLRQLARLRALGVPVQVALEPLVPGLTDTRANLMPLLEELARLSIRQVTVSYLFLRPGIRGNLEPALSGLGGASWLAEYARGPVLAANRSAPAQYLPKARRQRGYSAIMALAAEAGITVRINRLTNPDFRLPQPPAPPGLSLRRALGACPEPPGRAVELPFTG